MVPIEDEPSTATGADLCALLRHRDAASGPLQKSNAIGVGVAVFGAVVPFGSAARDSIPLCGVGQVVPCRCFFDSLVLDALVLGITALVHLPRMLVAGFVG